MASSDGKTRDLVVTIPGAGWDFALHRHPYHEIERPLGPHYCVYNRRLMACCFDHLSTEDGYWLLRQQAAVLNTGEYVLQFEGADAERLLDRLFTKDITRLRVGRCAYGLACYEDGGRPVLVRAGRRRFLQLGACACDRPGGSHQRSRGIRFPGPGSELDAHSRRRRR